MKPSQIPDLITQLELAVDLEQNLSSFSRDEVASANFRVQTIRRRLHANTLSPINRLAPELLTAIFKQVTASCASKPSLHTVHSNLFAVEPLFTLIRVCRLWRNVIVGDASFWSHIDSNCDERWLELLSKRSSGHPLTIYLSLENLALVDRILGEHAIRARAVHVYGTKDDPSDSILRQLRFDAPRAECFTLVSAATPDPIGPSEGLIFCQEISPLKALALDLPYVFLPTNSFPNLTHLFLSFGPFVRKDFASGLLRLLSVAPRLEHLQIAYQNTFQPSSESDCPRLVCLNGMRSLIFSECELGVVFRFLGHLVLPTRLLLCINDAGSHNRDINHHVIPQPPLLRTLSFLELVIQARDGYLLLSGYDAQSTSAFLIDANGLYWDFAQWVVKQHTMFPYSTITTLHVNIDLEASMELPSLLPHFVRLEELSVQIYPGGYSIEDSIQITTNLFAALTPISTVPCPELRFLAIEADTRHHLDVRGQCREFPLFFSGLKSMASERSRLGHPLLRFLYQRITTKADNDGMTRLFSSSLDRLTPYVNAVEYQTSSRVTLCPFVIREYWNIPEAEKYWKLPASRLPSYGIST